MTADLSHTLDSIKTFSSVDETEVRLFDIPLALYVHIPFCQTRCSYCSFNTTTGQLHRITDYMHTVEKEVQLVANTTRLTSDSLYFGGGTPSLVPVNALSNVLHQCVNFFELAPDTEITLEANPGTVNAAYLQALRRAGINRLSIGMQSAYAKELRLFGRQHKPEDVATTVELSRRAGFENINLDLIYGNPGQTLANWQHSLNTALDLEPEHLSLYSLSIEDGTPLQRGIAQGIVASPDSDLAADMYEWSTDRLAQAGYVQYEISNWARPGRACRHNLHYWRNEAYLGFGAGAHGSAAGYRYANVDHPVDYIQRFNDLAKRANEKMPFPLSPAVKDICEISASQAMSETMFMGLRLTETGICAAEFKARYKLDLWAVYGAALKRLIEKQLLEYAPGERVRLTRRGRLLGNHVFAEFLTED